MKEQYLPQWYLSKKTKEYRKNLHKVFILLVAFIVISSINVFEGVKGLKNYENKIVETTKLSKDEEGTFEIYYSYNYLSEILNEANIPIKKLNMDYEYIYLEVYAKDMKAYQGYLDILEKKFEIDAITPLSNNEDDDYFSIRMKIYEN